MARARLLDVSGDEPGQARTGRALRLNLEPQLRGPSGLQRPHPSGVAGDGGGGGYRGTFRRHPRLALSYSGRENARKLSPYPPAALAGIKHRAARPVLQFIPVGAAPVEQRPRTRMNFNARRLYLTWRRHTDRSWVLCKGGICHERRKSEDHDERLY